MAGNNNTVLVPTPDPFHLEEIIEESNPTPRRRGGRRRSDEGNGRTGHEAPQPVRRPPPQHVEQPQNGEAEQLQLQNNEEDTARNDRNAELIQTQPEPQQTRVQHETDPRDGQPAPPSPRSLERPRPRHQRHRDATDARGEPAPPTLITLKELQRTNRLIRLQG